MGILRNARHREPMERRAFGDLTAMIPPPGQGYSSFAGPTVTDDTSLAHIDVYKCRSLIADSISMLPLRAYRTKAYTDATGAVRTYGEQVPAQPTLLVDPMPDDLMSVWNLKHCIMDSLLGDGNSYLEIAAVDQLGYPTVLSPVDPWKVRKVRLDPAGHTVYEMHDGRLLGNVRNGGTMVHITGYKRAGSLTGVSPIMAGKQGIALSMATEEFGARFFGDGANPSGYIHTPNAVNEDEAKAIKRKWIQTYGGLNREPAVLYGGMEWHTVSISPEESQFILTRKFQSSQIAALFRIPPHLVGDIDKSTSWGTGIEEMGLGFVTFTLGAWISRIEQAFSFLLPRGQWAKFNVNALLRGRAVDQATVFATLRNAGVLSVNDIRLTLDLPPVPDGDSYIQPLNMIDIGAPPPPDAPPPAPSDPGGDPSE